MTNRWDNPDSLVARCLAGTATDADRARLAELARTDAELQATVDEWDACRYLEGVMAPTEREAFEQRLAAEPGLAAILTHHQELDDCFGELGGEDALLSDGDLAAQRQAIVGRARSRQRLRAWLIRPAIGALATAAMLLAVAGIWLGLTGTTPETPGTLESVASARVVAPGDRTDAAVASATLPRLFIPDVVLAEELSTPRGSSVAASVGGEQERAEPDTMMLAIPDAPARRPIEWIRHSLTLAMATWNRLAGT